MCLAVPGEITEIDGDAPLERMATVRFGGITRHVSLALVPEAKTGDFVLVHVGFAITVIDEAEAERVFDCLEQLGELEAAAENTS